MNKNIFLAIAISVFSLSIIVDMDFENLSMLDYAVIVSTLLMWLVNGVAVIKKRR